MSKKKTAPKGKTAAAADKNTVKIACRGAGTLPIHQLEPLQGQLKTLTDVNYWKLRREIEEDGFIEPISIWEDPESNKIYVLNGHQRLEVLTRMKADGWVIPQVPINFVDAVNIKDAKRKVLAMASQYGEVSSKGMKDFMAEFDFKVEDVDKYFSFPEIEISALLADVTTAQIIGSDIESNLSLNSDATKNLKAQKPKPEEAAEVIPPPPKKPKARRGDVWQLGRHRLMCGDSTVAVDVEKLMKGARADLIFTDPPWNVNYGAATTPKYKQGRQIMNDHMADDKWLEFVNGVCANLFGFSKPGAPIYLVMSAQEWPVVDKALREAKFHWSSTIIWAKDSLVLSRKDYHTQYEPIWYGWNDTGPRLAALKDRTQSDVWNVQRPKVSDLHPTTKPVELVERAIVNSSAAEGVVLDLFGGSGSTMIACEKSGRVNCSMELDPKYCDVIVQRWEEYTGKKALKVSDIKLKPKK